MSELAAVRAPLAMRLHHDVESILRLMGETAAAAGARAWEARSEEVVRHAYFVDATRFTRSEISERAGVGIQVYAPHGGAGYAYTSRLDPAAARAAALRAVDVARASLASPIVPPDRPTGARIDARPSVRDHPEHAAPEEKIALAMRAAAAASAVGQGLFRRVEAVWGETYGRRCYLASDGRAATFHPLHDAIEVTAHAREGAKSGSGRGGEAGALGLSDYAGERAPEAMGADAARRALANLRAEAMPAGRFPAILDPHLAGVLAHESFGHLSEYDTIHAKWSILHDREGDRLGPEHVSIADAGVMDNGVHVPIDDEATPGHKVTILERGVLKRFMHNRLMASAKGGGTESTGNGRCVSVSFPTMVRMRNTFFEPGDRDLDEMVKEMRNGYLAGGSTGGQPTADGSFVFRATEGWRVEDGEVTTPVKGVVLLGNILETMPRIRACSRDFRMHTMFFGGCGKWGQNDLPVGIGGPHLLLSEAHFGGNSA
ncbi:MAG TPA: TldD/PmbA family protein [Candidatus Thermoplasmatota archaeon]|nr:TldD/PmbA family protein [Candidatus Thermoplasmatota archaeon]